VLRLDEETIYEKKFPCKDNLSIFDEKLMKNILFLVFITMLTSSCARIYNSPDAINRAKSHKLIGVLTPDVTIPPQKKLTSDEIEQLKKEETAQLHVNMINWLLKRKEQNKITVNTLDEITTQTKLERKISEIGYSRLTIEENCECLKVDALLKLNMKLSKPMSTGAAIATTILFGFGNTNQAVANMELYDCKDNKMMWSFAHTISGGLFSTSEQLVNELMRIASKKLPYSKLE